jgi:hypothetical protein
MGHAIGDPALRAVLNTKPVPGYSGSWEELRVITNFENPAAKFLGEAMRNNHNLFPYYVAGPTSR